MSLFDEKQRRAVMRTFNELRRAAPAKPGEQYGAPGNGSSVTLSLVTIVALFALWYAATNGGWVKPLFLPSPQAVWMQLVDVSQEGFADQTLLAHIGWSALRVFGAFVLAVLTAIPVGIMMGVNRVARGIFDPLVEFYRPLPPLVATYQSANRATMVTRLSVTLEPLPGAPYCSPGFAGAARRSSLNVRMTARRCFSSNRLMRPPHHRE